MGRAPWTLALAALAAGCASVKTTAVDPARSTVEVCGKSDDYQDYLKEAARSCPPHLLVRKRCDKRGGGTVFTPFGGAFVDPEICCTFECSPQLP